MPRRVQHQAILFDMLRSFTTFACTRNLSETVRRLRTTRQTVRRHIDTLETMRGHKLMALKNGQYQLTRAGAQCLTDAETLLNLADTWMRGYRQTVDMLDVVNYQNEQGYYFHAQQHPVSRVWMDGMPILKSGLKAWTKAEGQIEHPEMKHIIPYALVYRRNSDGWVSIIVGERSSYATCLEWSYAASTIGSYIHQDPMSCETDWYIIQAYDYTLQTGGLWYDHISTEFPNKKGGLYKPLNYQRLLLACSLPNKSPAVMTLVARTNQLTIAGLNPSDMILMPDNQLMEFEP